MKVNIIVLGLQGVFTEFVQSLSISLAELGHSIENIQYSKEGPWTFSEVNFILFGKCVDIRPPKFSLNIMFQFEQWRNKKKFEIRKRFNFILDIFQDIKEKHPDNARFCPLGWSPAYETIMKPSNHLDYFFFGSANTPHRKWCIKEYPVNHVRLGCFGKDRDKMIMKSKINVMFKAYKTYNFAPLHAMIVICKSKFLAVEKCNSYSPFIPGKHFIEFSHFKETKKWLKNESQRVEFAQSAYEDLKNKYPYTKHLERALKGIL